MKEILELIENVDPDDTDTLDEIDARVWCFVHQEGEVVRVRRVTRNLKPKQEAMISGKWRIENTKEPLYFIPEFTRSRDALKAIRPEGFLFTHKTCNWPCKHSFISYRCDVTTRDCKWSFITQAHPTEELAELHAIIQAIAHER